MQEEKDEMCENAMTDAIKQLSWILPIIISFIGIACGQSSHGSSRPLRARPLETRQYHILALGDSYTIGESVKEHERWPVQLSVLIREQKFDVGDPTIIAKTGWTTDELDTAIDRENPQGLFDIVSLLIGVNNQYRGRSEQEYRAQFVDLLHRAIAFAGNIASHVIVLSIPDWGVTPFAEGRDRGKIAREIDLFNTVNREEANRAGAQYVDITPISREVIRDPSLIASDGLHPSGRMYAQWARLMLPQVVRIFGSE
jgi:lysophospholipase L1-like esterase